MRPELKKALDRAIKGPVKVSQRRVLKKTVKRCVYRDDYASYWNLLECGHYRRFDGRYPEKQHCPECAALIEDSQPTLF